MKLISAILFVLLSFSTFSQTLTQNVRGTVIDNESKYPLIGAKVKIISTDPVMGGICDERGGFAINNVPIGKHQLEVSSIGYKPKAAWPPEPSE